MHVLQMELLRYEVIQWLCCKDMTYTTVRCKQYPVVWLPISIVCHRDRLSERQAAPRVVAYDSKIVIFKILAKGG